MNDKIRSLVEVAKSNPRTSVLGVIVVALYGAGESMREQALEPWGSIVVGVAGVMTLITMLMAHDKPKAGE